MLEFYKYIYYLFSHIWVTLNITPGEEPKEHLHLSLFPGDWTNLQRLRLVFDEQNQLPMIFTTSFSISYQHLVCFVGNLNKNKCKLAQRWIRANRLGRNLRKELPNHFPSLHPSVTMPIWVLSSLSNFDINHKINLIASFALASPLVL